jgi:hypothetical protein
MTRKQFIRKISGAVLTLSAGLAMSAAAAPGDVALLTTDNPRVREVLAVQHAVTPGLMSLEGILGTAVGMDDAGQAALVIFVNAAGQNPGEVIRALPHAIKGVPVTGRLTDRFVPWRASPVAGVGCRIPSSKRPDPARDVGRVGI